MKRCTHCGTENLPQAQYCKSCWKPLADEEAHPGSQTPSARADSDSLIGGSAGERTNTAQNDLTANYLEHLRAHSACKGLRGSIAATFWFNATLWLIAAVGCIVLLTGEKSTELDKTEAKIGLVIVFFAVNALVVYRQMALMVVTVADSIVLRNRDAGGGYETQRQRSSEAAQQ
jgi:hypothetical protein